MRTWTILLAFTLLFSCRKKEPDLPGKNECLRQIRACREELEKHFLESMDRHPPQERWKSLASQQKAQVTEKVYLEFYGDFILQGKMETFSAFLKESGLAQCFQVNDCASFIACGTPRIFETYGARIDDEDVPMPGAELPADVPPAADPQNDPLQTDPKKPLATFPALSPDTFDISIPSEKTDLKDLSGSGRPAVWMAHGHELHLLQVKDNQVHPARTVDLKPYVQVRDKHPVSVHITRHGTVLIRTSLGILLLDSQFSPHLVWKPASGLVTGALAFAREDVLLVAAEGNLITLDSRFRETGRVSLGLGMTKNGHDILVHGNQALVLDNIVAPIYLFRVDVSDPDNPQILERILDQKAPNAHLLHQWVDEREKLWAVVRSSYGRAGSSQHILQFDLHQKPDEDPDHEHHAGCGHSVTYPTRSVENSHPVWRESLTHSVTTQGGSKPEKTGFRFLSGSSEGNWILASDSRELHLGRYQVDAKGARFKPELSLSGSAKNKPRTAIGEPDFTAESLRGMISVRGNRMVAMLSDRLVFLQADRKPVIRETHAHQLPMPQALAIHP